MLDAIFAFYFDYIEPGSKIFIFIFAIMVVIWLVDVMRQPGAHLQMAGAFVRFTWNAVFKTCVWIWMAILWTFNMILRGIRLTFATVRDFFTSKI